MAAHRKYPPQGAAEVIQQLASQGFSLIGIAKHFKVAKSTVKRWFDENESLEEAFEMGRETERQALHALVVQSAVMNKPANVNAFFILKSRHGYRENDSPNTNINVAVPLQPVLVVKDHGTDAEWAAKCEEQQRRLTAPDPQTIPARLPAPQYASETSAEPVSDTLPIPAPVALPRPHYAPAWKPRG